MKVPFSWLKCYVDIGKISSEKVAEALTIAGLEVVLIEKIGDDSVFDIEVTPNRPDCLSILGIAREVSASLGKKLKMPRSSLSYRSRTSIKKPSIEIKDNNLCPRYTARIIRDVKVGPSPKWLEDNIKKMGLRPVNNIVDITNYCLFELGQPTHAFDYDKLEGKVIVRRARKNEKIATIDGKSRTLDSDMLVIADEKKAIALGGVMGSKETEVTEATENILFESAYFNPVSIRRTSRRLGLISESSYRFERSVDMGGIVAASERASGLIAELCGGKIGPLKDVGKKDPKDIKIYLRPERLKKILGLDISILVIKKILSLLQLKVGLSGKKTLVVSVPSFRQDLKAEVDLIEEVVRIYGYDKLPSTMPTIVGHPKRVEPARKFSNIVRDTLVSLGIDEVITYSLISKEELSSVEYGESKSVIAIENPLSREQGVMRTTIAPGILETVSWNLNRGIGALSIFELGNIYLKDAGRFKEEENAAIAFVTDSPHGWHGRALSFFDIKGAIEALFERLGIEEVLFKGEGLPPFLTDEASSIEVSGEAVGFAGRVKKEVLDTFDIKTDNVILCELSLKRLLSHAKLEKKFRKMPRFPSAKREMSMDVKKGISHQEIVSLIKETGGGLVVNIELLSEYFGQQIKQGRGLSYSIEYRSEDKTLTDSEISSTHNKICGALTQKLEVRIR